MSKVLHLYNTFTKCLNPVELGGRILRANSNDGQLLTGSLYICGPTVYSDCHVGHALTYIRADLLRRFLKSTFNVRLLTVMNITDIDDKILAKTNEEFSVTDEMKANPSSHPFNRVSDKYFKSFVQDMESIKVTPPDLYIKVSEQVDLIKSFISKLEENGHTYVNGKGDVQFRVSTVPSYIGRIDSRRESNEANDTKTDPRDFVVWKTSKPKEPVWIYNSPKTGLSIPGRPGWHIQCSAISSAIFGGKLDIHFGGKDLIFPHHYNEEACCCAYHKLDTSNSLHVWSNHWLHSGHLVYKDSKMSKSLGNVMAIKNFINRTSVNALRLLCVHSHYRADINFDEDLFDHVKALDHKISAFSSFLTEGLQRSQENLSGFQNCAPDNSDVEQIVYRTHDEIIQGVCDDLDLSTGLDSILNLSKYLYSKGLDSLRPKDVMIAWALFKNWSDICGLDYGLTKSYSDSVLLELLLSHRQAVRLWAIKEMKSKDATEANKQSLKNLLNQCDRVRRALDDHGFVTRDTKT